MIASTGRARIAALLALLPLAGCGDDVARAFGFTRNSPDEFTVTTRAPLSLPASDALVPPEPGAARPQEQGARTAALEAIAPDVALQGTGGVSSPGQSALVAQATRAASAPRRRGGELRDSSGGIVDGLLFWQAHKAGAVVDASAENQRLAQAAASGSPPTDGPTPIIASASR